MSGLASLLYRVNALNRALNRIVLVAVLAAIGLTAFGVQTVAQAADFPLRAKYAVFGVKPITTQELSAHINQYVIVDARSDYEYKTLHIKGATSIPVASQDFIQRVRALAKKTKKTLVFYCNGVTCSKSYDATAQAIQGGVTNVLVYDAGVFAWATAHPDDAVLFGKPLKSAKKLISKADFDAHCLAPNEFFKRVDADKQAIIIDIRDADQRAGVSLFQMRDHHVPLDNDRLKAWVDKAKAGKHAMYFVDATGKQVEWLQYFLKDQGVKDYWFMKGGVRAFYKSMTMN